MCRKSRDDCDTSKQAVSIMDDTGIYPDASEMIHDYIVMKEFCKRHIRFGHVNPYPDALLLDILVIVWQYK